MSDHEEPQAPEQEGESKAPSLGALPFDTDYFLQGLIRLANDGIEIGITVNCGGFLVSGMLVGGKRYFEEHLLGQIVPAMPAPYRQPMQDFFSSFAEIYKRPDEDEEPAVPNTPVFVHLKGARFYHHSGKPIPTNDTLWWRGRISQIQGLVLGNLGESGS